MDAVRLAGRLAGYDSIQSGRNVINARAGEARGRKGLEARERRKDGRCLPRQWRARGVIPIRTLYSYAGLNEVRGHYCPLMPMAVIAQLCSRLFPMHLICICQGCVPVLCIVIVPLGGLY